MGLPPQPHVPCESPRQPWLDAGLRAQPLEALMPGSHLQKCHLWRVGWAHGFPKPLVMQGRCQRAAGPPTAPSCLLHSCPLVLGSGSQGDS